MNKEIIKISLLLLETQEEKYQDKLKTEIIKKIKFEYNTKEEIPDLIKIEFKSPYWSKSDPGYIELKDLINNNKFDKWGKNYSLYIGNIENGCDVRTACFEVIWDYQTYLKLTLLEESIINLSKETQEEVLKTYKHILNKYKTEEQLQCCFKKGHSYTTWAKKTNANLKSETEEVYERTCKICGYIETSSLEPLELIKEREQKETQERIRALKLELQQLEMNN